MAVSKQQKKPVVISLPQAHFARGVLSVGVKDRSAPVADFMRVTPRSGFGVVFTQAEQTGKVIRFLAVHSDDWFKVRLESIPDVVGQLMGLKDRLFRNKGQGVTAHYVCAKGYDMAVSLAVSAFREAGIKPDRSVFYRGKRLILLDMHAGQVVMAEKARGVGRTRPIAVAQREVRRYRNQAEDRKILPPEVAFEKMSWLIWGGDTRIEEGDLVSAPLREFYLSDYGPQPARWSRRGATQTVPVVRTDTAHL